MPVMTTATGCSVGVNDRVKVKLSEHGRRIYTEYGANDAAFRAKMGVAPFEIAVDPEGFTSFVFWELMMIFGSAMFTGAEPLFKENRVYFDYATAARLG